MPRYSNCNQFLVALLLLSLLQFSCRTKPRRDSGIAADLKKSDGPKSLSNLAINPGKPSTTEEWNVVEQVKFDWNGDGNPFDLVAEHTTAQEGGGEFTRVKFLRAGKLIHSFEDQDGLTLIGESVGPRVIEYSKHNLLKSNFFLALPEITNSANKPLLFLFGWAYASQPGSFHAFELKSDGVPNLVMSEKFFTLVDFTNQNRSIVGGGSSELFGPCFENYNPFFVYSWAKNPSKGFQVDEKLCKEYNITNYYGWAGMPADKSLVVVLRPPHGGKPIILPEKEAEALFQQQ